MNEQHSFANALLYSDFPVYALIFSQSLINVDFFFFFTAGIGSESIHKQKDVRC